MVMIYTTGVTLQVGSTSGNAITQSTGIKAFTYDEQQGESGEGASPVFTINSTTPMGYNPPHKYVKLTIQAVSDLYNLLYNAANGGPFIVPGGDNVLINTTSPATGVFIVTATSNGSPVTFTCKNVMPGKATMTIDPTGKEVLTLYSFKCDSITPSA
jgi:hypothetical protein